MSDWEQMKEEYSLTSLQCNQLERYAHMISEGNKRCNLTAITQHEDIKALHIQDSLALAKMISLSAVQGIVDIGTGAGLPGIPLKICFPHLFTVLIEVNGKKRTFLQEVVDTLELQNVVIYSQDWRTFLRNTHFQVDILCARASLQPEELVRMFKASSPYKDKRLFYWASGFWKPTASVEQYIKTASEYSIFKRSYTLIEMSNEKKASTYDGK